MRFLDADDPDDESVIRAVGRYLLVESGVDRPSRLFVEQQSMALAALIRTGMFTLTVQLDTRDDVRSPREWVHLRIPDGGMDAYIALDDLFVEA